jgi:hypothetical protein
LPTLKNNNSTAYNIRVPLTTDMGNAVSSNKTEIRNGMCNNAAKDTLCGSIMFNDSTALNTGSYSHHTPIVVLVMNEWKIMQESIIPIAIPNSLAITNLTKLS